MKQNSLHVGTLAKGLRLLRAFDESHVSLTLTELVERTGLEKSAVQRMAHTLHVEGMLDRDPDTRRYRPSHAWLELAYVYYWSNPLISRALPKLIEFSRTVGETVNLAQMSGDHIIYALRLPNHRTHFAASIVGRRVPALATASGRVMLATRSEAEYREACASWPLPAATPRTITDRAVVEEDVVAARRNGYAITEAQVLLNEISLAVPIIGTDGRADAAVQVSLSSLAYDFDRVRREILPVLLDTTASIQG
ncbi:IclR family transcriptional regulator [Salipiger bermudensis]|uniref:IclR family transcriptional regulator n=1 Tax=Salipiger bermudensis TaxID=344736 RepID=UPI001CD34893|nr:IclR family transcriptional regulator [Salipiger bermudensis]MCA0964179.1 IclR family transcriptional regulator [Salipiger bermudensis]